MNFIFLILPVLSHASLTFNITISRDELKVRRDDHDVKVISDLERQSFELTDQSVKEAMAILYPDVHVQDIYVRSPTPLGDLYELNEWQPVTRETKVQDSYIKSFKNEQVSLMKKNYFHVGDATSMAVTFDNYSLPHVDIVARNLYEGTKMSVSINHNINLRHGIKPVDTLEYVSELNDNTLHKIEKTYQVKSKSGLQFMLHPLQTIEVSLIAQKLSMEFHVLYTTRIRGTFFVNTFNPRTFFSFWDRKKRNYLRPFSVGSLLNAIKKPQEWNGTSVLFIEYYANAKLVLKDKTGKVIQEDEVEYAD